MVLVESGFTMLYHLNICDPQMEMFGEKYKATDNLSASPKIELSFSNCLYSQANQTWYY